MSDPPRRRRSTPPSRRSSETSSVWPTIALGIGVVVAGLGIGAFLSAMQHKDSGTTTATATSVPRGVPVVTPVGRPTLGPLAAATPIAHPTPSPTPAASATPQATATPAATPRPSVTPRPTATPRATPSPRPSETPKTAPTATGRPTPTPRATPTLRAETPRPTRPPTIPPTRPPTAAPPLTFGVVAQNTVRRYLTSLIAGNENAAYAELGKPPGSGGLTEEAFIDRQTRITSVRTTSSDANAAVIEVELSSARGSYFATYHVTNTPTGPVIDQHDYIKV